jgi:hypothetical protein
MALQRTRALAVARVRSLPPVARRSPLNAQPFGGTSERFQRRNSYAWSESDRALPIPT